MPLSVHKAIVYALIAGVGMMILTGCILVLTNRPIPEDLKSLTTPLMTALLGLVAVPQETPAHDAVAGATPILTPTTTPALTPALTLTTIGGSHV